jgi:glycosyltransferase involved in cell wall biosynthesis
MTGQHILELESPPRAAAAARRAHRHVAFFLPSFGGGGAQRMLLNLANAFEESGCRVDLVVVRKEGPFLKEVPKHIRIVTLGSDRLRFALWRLIAYLRRERPEAMMATLTSASLLAVLACRLSFVGTRLVLRQASSMRRSQRPWLVRRVYPAADAFIAISGGIADDLTEIVGLPPKKVYTIRNPAFTPEIVTRAAEPVDHPWFEPGGTPVVIAVGRLMIQKGFAVLIDAFARVRAQRRCRLVILGEGELRGQLEAQVERLGLTDDVWMPGFVDNPFKYLARSDLFVMSSKFEAFGNVIVEAMAVGTPVVSTDCAGGPPEILERGRWGDLVPVGDHEAMADAIVRNLECPPRRRDELREYARTFDSRVVAREYMDVLGVGRGNA